MPRVPSESEYRRIREAVLFVERNKQQLLRKETPRRRAWDERTGGGAGLSHGGYAEITAVVGTAAPFEYSVRTVAYSVGGEFGSPSGDAIVTYNLAEIGDNGVGVAAIPVGSVIVLLEDDAGNLLFDRSNYRGTY